MDTPEKRSESENPFPAGSGGEDRDPRWERIRRYQEVALEKPDVLQSNLGVVTGGLLKYAYRLERWLDTEADKDSESPRKREQLRTNFDDYLRVTRQIERFMQLEVRSNETRNDP